MATFTKLPLSASVNGKQIFVQGSLSSSTTFVHQAVTGTTSWDEVYLYATNINTGSVTVGVYWGNTGSADLCYTTVPNQAGRYLIADGKLLQNGLTVSAFATNSGSINLDGFVNRIV